MEREILIHYDVDEIVSVMKRHWLSESGWFYILTIGAVCLALGFFVLASTDPFLLGFLGGALCMLFIGLYWGYAGTIRETIQRVSLIPSLTATIRLTETRLSIKTESVYGEFEWSVIDEVRQFPSVWLLFERRALFAMLPLQNIDEEAQQFILTKLREHRAVVR
jgi:hypothetical protein